MSFSVQGIKDIAKTFSPSQIISGSALGIDIGTSSIKIVQLRKEKDIAVLESYGEIELSRYEGGALSPEKISSALMDLMSEIKTSSKSAGVSILSSSTLIFVVEMPTRDEEQLKLLMPAEAKKYIPAHSGEVMLDWFKMPDVESQQNVFDAMNEGSSVAPKRQKILLAAIYKETIGTYGKILKGAGVSPRFYEIEASSGARASLGATTDTVLIIDLGATATKIYIVERNIVRVLHTVKVGGNNLTKALAEKKQLDIKGAENLKRAQGLDPSLEPELEQIVAEANFVIGSYREQQKKEVTQVILIGGGARMMGIEDYLKTKLQLPAEVARPFNRTKGPIVLEGSLHDAGPIFANAIGLALRAVGM
ncbi:MAG: type IV pilus assembly protein PilM [Candidatus Kaiserbacteria bacterium]|nr:type IV pilus assembly protein PilM [Candidatus Kaiserbacteria bacterium]